MTHAAALARPKPKPLWLPWRPRHDDLRGKWARRERDPWAGCMMARPHTEPGVRRIGLPDRTMRAIVETMPCPTCGAAIGHRCRVVVGKRKGRACGPHGERIQSWMDHGMPRPTTRRDAADEEV